MKILILMICVFFEGLLQAQNRISDSLISISNSNAHDTIKITALNALSWQCFLTGDYSKSMTYSEEALQKALKLNYLKGIAVCYLNKGNVESFKGNINKALFFFLEALKISEKLNNNFMIAQCYSFVGNNYMDLVKYDQAVEYHKKALEIFKHLVPKNSKWLSYCYSNLGNIYGFQKKYDEAFESHSMALEIRNRTNDIKGLSASYVNIGAILFLTGKLDEALKNQVEALKIKTILNDKDGIAICHSNIANVYIQQKKYGKATESIGNAMKIVKVTGNKESVKNNYHLLVVIDSTLSNFKSAFEHHKLYMIYKDSVLSEETKQKAVQAEMQFGFDKMQAADSLRNRERMLEEQIKHKTEIEKQQMYIYVGSIFILLMIVVSITSFRAYRQKQKANRMIIEQKNLVDAKQKEILDSINYAQKIQNVLMTSEKYIDKTLQRLKNDKG